MQTNRRAFLGAAAAAGTLAAARGLRAADADKKVALGVIGTGWYGVVDAKAALKAGGAEIAAVCDVDSAHLKQSADEIEKLQGKRPREHKLYKEMFEAKGLDAVIIGTPPHWHALQFIDALKAGLDVYCEKPLSYDVREGRAMVDAAKAHPDRMVQVGFQRRQSQAFKQAKAFIDAGNAGRIVQVDVQIHYRAGTKETAPQDPPATLDWDLWCGPGPRIPYSPQVGHKSWRLERTSGHGHLVDWGIHLIDATRVILGLGMPTRIVAAGGIYQLKGKITTPDTLTAHFDFDRCPVVWRHRLWGATEYAPEVNNGIFFYGEAATVFATDQRWVVLPAGKGKERQEHKVRTDLGLEHMKDFLAGVRTRKAPSCTPEDAYKTTATVQLAMIAHETNSAVTWDAAKEQIVGNEAASKLLKREYRAPYKHPYTG